MRLYLPLPEAIFPEPSLRGIRPLIILASASRGIQPYSGPFQALRARSAPRSPHFRRTSAFPRLMRPFPRLAQALLPGLPAGLARAWPLACQTALPKGPSAAMGPLKPLEPALRASFGNP